MFRFRASYLALALLLVIPPLRAVPPAKSATGAKPHRSSSASQRARAAAPEQVAGIYSNLEYVEEAGDLVGMELMIVPGSDQEGADYSAFVQIAEGGFPSTAIVPLTLTGRHVELTLPPSLSDNGAKLQGDFAADSSLILHWEGSAKSERLKRGPSHWQ